jgi:hypothetical protein
LLVGWVLWICSHISTAGADSLSLQLENDSFDGASDAYYTQGFQLIYTPGKPVEWPKKFPFFAHANQEIRGQYFLGHAIFTPYEIGETQLLEYDRPYAGWLYLGAALLTEQAIPQSHIKAVDRLEFSLGVVGPSSGADKFQRWTHRLIDTYEVNGWHNQLHDEPAVLVSYAKKWAYNRPLGQSGIDWELGATLGGSLGNVNTQFLSGFGLRLGRDLFSSVGIKGVQPSTTSSHYYVPPQTLGWYLFTDWQLRYVARDIFLDGNTFKESHSVEKEPWVGDWSFGAAFSAGRYQLLVYHARRSREFELQYENANFSGVSLTSSF